LPRAPLGATCGAAFWILVAPCGMKLLIIGTEHKGGAALDAGQRTVGIDHASSTSGLGNKIQVNG
jgi:hypothetical protein